MEYTTPHYPAPPGAKKGQLPLGELRQLLLSAGRNGLRQTCLMQNAVRLLRRAVPLLIREFTVQFTGGARQPSSGIANVPKSICSSLIVLVGVSGMAISTRSMHCSLPQIPKLIFVCTYVCASVTSVDKNLANFRFRPFSADRYTGTIAHGSRRCSRVLSAYDHHVTIKIRLALRLCTGIW